MAEMLLSQIKSLMMSGLTVAFVLFVGMMLIIAIASLANTKG